MHSQTFETVEKLNIIDLPNNDIVIQLTKNNENSMIDNFW